jgi:multiple sugar transport system substrate-binding protein
MPADISRRRFLQRTCLAALTAGIWPYAAGCTSGGRSAVGGSRAAAEIDSLDLTGRRIAVSFWHTQTGPKADKLNAIVEAFNRSQPSVEVKPEYQGDYNAIFKKLLSAVSARQAPDVAVSYPSMVSEYQSANQVLVLDNYVASARYGLTASEQQDYVEPYWDEGKYPEYGKNMLSFPFTKSLLVMYYNADRLKAAGVAKAPGDWTWEDFVTAARAVSDAGTKGWAIAVSASTFDGMIYSRGGRLISDDQKHWLFNQQPGVDSLALHQAAAREGWGYLVSQANGDQADFAAGRAVFTLSSSSGFPFYKTAVDQGGRFNWNVAVLPRGNGANPSTVLYGGSLTVFKSTAERQLGAWLFLKYFSSPDVTADWSVATGYVPVRQSAIGSDLVQAAMKASPAYASIVQTIAQYGRPETSVRGTEDTRAFIEDAITRVVSDAAANPKAALDDAAHKGDQALAA